MVRSSFASKSYRDNAVVLRTYKLGEADRIITLLTKKHGVVRAVAKGIRKSTSRFGARLEPFMVIDVLLVQGKNLDIITQVESLGAYTQPIVSDYELFTVATVMAETAERLCSQAPSTYQEYALFIGALGALNTDKDDPKLILDSYLLRSISLAGWTPSFSHCVVCSCPGPHTSLSIPLGGVVCTSCRPPGAMAPSEEVLQALDGLLKSRWARARLSSPEIRKEIHAIVVAYIQYHLDKKMKSIKYMEYT